MVIIILLALAGFAVSLYGFLVELWIKKNPLYKPVCDISDRISCSKPLRSKYSHLFGVTNTVLGMAYYLIVAAAALFGFNYLVLLLTISGCIATLCFAYILYVKIRSLCLICSATYAINIALLLVAILNK